MSSNLYNIESYSDEELFSLLDLNNPSDRELEARVLFLIHKYENMQNKSGNDLVGFFTKIYNHFFESEEEEEEEEEEDAAEEGFQTVSSTRYEYKNKDGTTFIDPSLQTANTYNQNAINQASQQYSSDNPLKTYVAPTGNVLDISSAAPIIGYNTLGNVVDTESAYRSGDVGLVKPLDYAKDNLNPLLQQTIKRIISIDSQYRENKQSLSTDFMFNLSDPLKDVVSLKLYSVQIPYTWYTINKSYGSNIFYIKGNSPGINMGNFDFKIEITPGNYTPIELVTALNTSIKNMVGEYNDISFGNTGIKYDSNTSLITSKIDITQQYSENSYEFSFAKWTTPNDNGKKETDPRFLSIPGFLGFNYQKYYPNMIRSTPSLSFKNDSITEDTTVRKYYVDNTSNYYFTVIKYDGPNELTMNPGTQYYDMSFVNHVDLSFQIALTIRRDTTRSLLVTDISNQIAACPYLTHDSSIMRIDISNSAIVGDQNSYFQITMKPNRNTTNNRVNSKMAIIFPFEAMYYGYNPIWTGSTSCFRFSDINHLYELNTIISETSPVSQQSNYYNIKSSPYIYLRCITPGFAITSDDVSLNNTLGAVDKTNIYIYQDFSNDISRYPIKDPSGLSIGNPLWVPTYDYVNFTDLSCNDYIIPLPNSTGIGYTITDYINAINTSITNRSNYTITAINIAGDINLDYTTTYVDNNAFFNIQFDINKKFTQDKYMVDLTNTYLNQVIGLPQITYDLSATNQIVSHTFLQSNYYTLSGEYLAIIKPSEKNYGNRHQCSYVIPMPPKNFPTVSTNNMAAFSTWQYDTYQELQRALNYQFQIYTDPSDNTRVLTGTKIDFTFNPSTVTIDTNFTVVVQKILTEKDYSIQFIDPSLSTYKDFYTATKLIDKESIYVIDNLTPYTYYTDISSAYNVANHLGILPQYIEVPNSIANSRIYSTYYVDLSSVYNSSQNSLINSMTIDANDVYILGSNNTYYTDLSSIYNNVNLPNIKNIHRNLDVENLYVLNSTINYYTDISSAYNSNKNKFTRFLGISKNETYVPESNYIVSENNPYPDMIPIVVDNPSNVYLLDSDTNFYCYEVNQIYYIDLINDNASSVPYDAIWFINKLDGNLYHIVNARNITSITSTYININRPDDNVFLMDLSANYYYDLPTSKYYYDPNISVTIDPSSIYFVGQGIDDNYHIFILHANTITILDSSPVIQTQISNDMYFMMDSPSNYYLDLNNNYYINSINRSSNIISPGSSIYLLGQNLLANGSIGIYNNNSVLGNTHIYRYDISTNSYVYSINSSATTISENNVNGYYLLDNSKNYYFNTSSNSYLIDPLLISPIGNTVYYIDISGSNNYIYKRINTNSNTTINYINSSPVIYNDISNIFIIDNSANYYVDSSENYFIDPIDGIYKPESHKSIYFIYNTNENPALNSGLGYVISTKIIRVDVSNAYIVDKVLLYYDKPDYSATTWSSYLKVNTSMIEHPYMLANVSTSNVLTGAQYAAIQGSNQIEQNRFTLNTTNNILSFTPYENGVFDYDGQNTISIYLDVSSNITANSYTRDGLITFINNTIKDTIPSDASGTHFSIIKDDNGNEYTKLRVNVNKIYSAADYRVSYYDIDSFVKCYVGISSAKNTTWDSTLGWILGYRQSTIYALSDFGKQGVPIEIIGDTCVSTNLFNYFMICLDDYNQNHLNDGLVTVTSKDIDISLPSYANRTQFQCDPITGNKTYSTLPDATKNYSNLTQNQLYSLTQIANSKSNIIKTNSSGAVINSKSYGLGPFARDVFGLIPMKLAGLGNGQYFVEFGGTLQNQDRIYFGPVNIHRMSVKLISDRGDVVDLNGANWSFSLICEQLYKQSGKQ